MLANGRSIEGTLQRLIDLIYEATLNDGAFSEYIKELALATNSHFAGLEIVDPSASNLCKWQSAAAYGLPAETVSGFNETYGAYNPFVNLVADTAVEGSIFTDSDVLKRKEFVNMLYYDEFLRHYDFEYISGMYVIHSNDISVIASTSKGKLAGDFTREEREVFRLTLPHLQKFFRIKQHIDETRMQRDASSDALNQLQHGAILIDAFGKILFSNAAADQITTKKDGLAVTAGRLTATHAGSNSDLSKTLNAAIASYDQIGDFQGKYDAAVSRRSGGRPYHVQAIPLKHARRLYLPSGPAVLILIFDPQRDLNASVETLMFLYELTESEANVALLIANGYSLESIANLRGHSIATTRTILKRVFSKTDTHRQNELASLLFKGQ